MDSVLSFIFFLIVGFYLAGLLGRLLLRRWIIRKQKEFEQGGNPFFRTYTWGGGGHSRNAKPKPEGKVTVEQTRMTQKRVSGDVGDYVEYEEIKVSRETESGTDADASGREQQQKERYRRDQGVLPRKNPVEHKKGTEIEHAFAQTAAENGSGKTRLNDKATEQPDAPSCGLSGTTIEPQPGADPGKP